MAVHPPSRAIDQWLRVGHDEHDPSPGTHARPPRAITGQRWQSGLFATPVIVRA